MRGLVCGFDGMGGVLRASDHGGVSGFCAVARCLLVWGIMLGMLWGGAAHAAPQSGPPENRGKLVSMDFGGVELMRVIGFVAEMAGKNYVLDPSVKGKVTVITPGPVSIDEAEKIFLSILSVHNLRIVQRDGVFKIIPDKIGGRESGVALLPKDPFSGEQEVVVSRLIRVKHIDPVALVKTLRPLTHKWGSVAAHLPSRSLIITDAEVTVTRLVTLVNAMDIPPNMATHALFPIRYGTVAQLEKLLNSVFAEFNSRRLKSDPHVKLFSDVRTNTLVAVAPREQLSEVGRLVRKLDKPMHSEAGNLHLYYPKNGKAEVIAKALNDLIGTAQVAGKGGPTAHTGRKPLEFLRQVNVVGEKETNTLVVAATKEDYATLLPILRGLDMRRLQVHVEALIIEVSAKRSAEFGVEWGLANLPQADSHAMTGFGGSGFGNLGAASSNPLALGGLTVGLLRGNSAVVAGSSTLVPGLSALVRSLQGDLDVNVLATPNIITMENEEAEIVSGKNVPILTGNTSSTTVANTTNTYDRKDVGLILRITPQVIEDGWLRLKIFQERSSVEESSSASSNEGLFTTKKDSIQTVVTLRSGQTVVLGGLINQEDSGNVNQVPCLGGIFGLGELFKSTVNKQEKTNLMVFINPTIINTYSDLLKISDQKYQESRALWERDVHKGSRLIPGVEVPHLPSQLNPPPEIEKPLRFHSVFPGR